MKVFDGFAPQDDLEPGDVAVALDPQERLGERTWLVFIQGDGTLEGDTVQLGLFWERSHAVMFAAEIDVCRRTRGIMA